MCSKAHIIQLCTLYDLAYMNSYYKTMPDRRIEKKMKCFHNDLNRICGPL